MPRRVNHSATMPGDTTPKSQAVNFLTWVTTAAGVKAAPHKLTKGSFIKKSLLLAGALMVTGLAGATGVGVVSAATSTSTNPQASLVQKIATKFGLKTTDVQAVFDQQHTEDEATRTAAEKTRLDAAVKDGKITQAQEDLIVAKQAEMRNYMDSLKDKTEAERHDAMKTKMDELKTWAATNNIPTEYLHGAGGHGGHMGPGGPHGDMTPPTDSTN